MRRLASGLVLAVWLAPCVARATWSIVAVDPATREVGVAGASCIADAHVIAGLAPGRGAIAAQAIPSFALRDHGTALLADGASPRDVIAALTSHELDHFAGISTSRLRQYGVAALGFESEPASFTGNWTFAERSHALGSGISVQGNLLASAALAERALAAFAAPASGGPPPLAERLLRALEAGAAAGGDARCLPEQAALSAFLIVAGPNDPPGAPSLVLHFPDDTGDWNSPMRLMTGEIAQRWRRFRGEASEIVSGNPERNPVRALRRMYEAR